jgi:hypothetical protein
MIELSYVGTKKGLMEYIGREICEDCLGEGVLYFMESDGEGHYADTGMKTCRCQLPEEEYDNQDE